MKRQFYAYVLWLSPNDGSVQSKDISKGDAEQYGSINEAASWRLPDGVQDYVVVTDRAPNEKRVEELFAKSRQRLPRS